MTAEHLTARALPAETVNGIANDFVEEGLPVLHDVERGEPVAFLTFYFDDAVGDIGVGGYAFLLEGHQ